MSKLVSIISPCYNGEKYVARYIESVLSQTYDNIEFIIVNDGSTDKTEEVIMSYKNRFKEKGYKFIYIRQDNAGQSAAINQGLAIFTGDYMTWIDSDDYLPSNAIERKVKLMEDNPTAGICLCSIKVVEEGTFKKIGIQQRKKPIGEDELCKDLIRGNNVFYTPGGYMVRSSMFREAMPKPLQIQTPRVIGQNFQLLLPITFKYPACYTEEILFYYTVRRGSHSRVKHSFEEEKNIMDVSRTVLYNIVRSIDTKEEDKQELLDLVEQRLLSRDISLLLKFKRKDHIDELISELKKRSMYNRQMKVNVMRIKHPIFDYIYRFAYKAKSRIKIKNTKH